MHKQNLNKLICSMLIGDGSIYYSGNRSNPSLYFSITHCRAQKDYLIWKTNLLNLELNQRKIGKEFIVKDYMKKCKDKYFPVSTTVIGWKEGLIDLYNEVYPIYLNRQKSIKALLFRMNDLLSTAIWFADDGNEDRNYTKSKLNKNIKFKRSPRYRLGTYGFTDGEINLSIDWFIAKYNITPRRSEQNGGPILIFNVRDSKKLFDLIINPYLSQIKSMRYKFRWSFEKYCLVEAQSTSIKNIDEDTVQTTTREILD